MYERGRNLDEMEVRASVEDWSHWIRIANRVRAYRGDDVLMTVSRTRVGIVSTI